MPDIADQLLEAIAAKEVKALATSGLEWRTHDTYVNAGGHCAVVMNERDKPLVAWLPTFRDVGWDVPGPWANATFIADNDPADTLRRCAADREIVKECVKWLSPVPHLADFVLAQLARGYGIQP